MGEASILTAVAGETALREADALGRKAASVGFDWDHPAVALDKVREEVEELGELLDEGVGLVESDVERDVERATAKRRAEELGDLLFAVVNVARKLELDPEEALRSANEKFRRRFASIEDALAAEGLRPEEVDLERLEALWGAAKQGEGEGPKA